MARVALIFQSIASLVPALLGVLKAGKVYVPVDPARIPRTGCGSFSKTPTRAWSSPTATPRSWPGSWFSRACPISITSTSFPTRSPRSPCLSRPLLDDIATLLYTSGSTGVPKGVMQNHRNLLQHVRNYTNNLGIRSDDRISLLFSYSFSASLLDIFGALLNGAALCPFDVRNRGAGCPRALGRGGGDHPPPPGSQPLPTPYRRSSPARSPWTALRRVDHGGRADPRLRRRDAPAAVSAALRAWCTASPHPRRASSPTTRSAPETAGGGGRVAGRTCRRRDGGADRRRGGQGRSRTGAVGEIVLRGDFLCPGYWKRPDLTEKVIVRGPGRQPAFADTGPATRGG